MNNIFCILIIILVILCCLLLLSSIYLLFNSNSHIPYRRGGGKEKVYTGGNKDEYESFIREKNQIADQIDQDLGVYYSEETIINLDPSKGTEIEDLDTQLKTMLNKADQDVITYKKTEREITDFTNDKGNGPDGPRGVIGICDQLIKQRKTNTRELAESTNTGYIVKCKLFDINLENGEIYTLKGKQIDSKEAFTEYIKDILEINDNQTLIHGEYSSDYLIERMWGMLKESAMDNRNLRGKINNIKNYLPPGDGGSIIGKLRELIEKCSNLRAKYKQLEIQKNTITIEKTNNEILSQIEMFKKNINYTINQIKESNIQIENVSKEINNLREQINGIDVGDTNNLTQELTKLQETLAELNKEKNNLDIQLSENIASLTSTIESISSLSAQIAKNEALIKELRDKTYNVNGEETISNDGNILNIIESKMKDINNKLYLNCGEILKTVSADLQKSIQLFTKYGIVTGGQTPEDITKALLEKLEEHKNKLKENNDILANLNTQKEEKEQEKSKVETLKTETEKNIEDTNSSINKITGEIDSIKNNISENSKQIEEKNAELTEMEEKLRRLNTEYTTLSEQDNKITEKLDELNRITNRINENDVYNKIAGIIENIYDNLILAIDDIPQDYGINTSSIYDGKENFMGRLNL